MLDRIFDTIANILGIVILFVITIFFFALLLAGPTYYLWNWLMPIIFKLPEITFWQALGLNFLSGIFFKKGSSTTTKKE